MKEQENDKLRGLFQEMELDTLPQEFEMRLMQQIHQVEAKNVKNRVLKNQIINILAIVGGIVAMIAIPLVIFYFITGNIGIQLPKIEVDYSLLKLKNVNPLAIFLPTTILVLLMADTLIRKHLTDKKHR